MTIPLCSQNQQQTLMSSQGVRLCVVCIVYNYNKNPKHNLDSNTRSEPALCEPRLSSLTRRESRKTCVHPSLKEPPSLYNSTPSKTQLKKFNMGVNINIQDCGRRTPTALSVFGHPPWLSYLYSQPGIDFAVKNDESGSCIDYALSDKPDGC